MKKVALVTGGTRGIGLGIARCLARTDHDLVLCGRKEESAVDRPLEELRALGAEVHYCQADVGVRAAREALVLHVRDRIGRLNLLVNNAGTGPAERRDILEATEESYDHVLKVNLQGPYFLTQAVANWMIEQKRAAPDFCCCIININSISATAASVNRGEYCISKAGLAMATSLWAVRLAEFNIPVYEVRPGIVQTDMTAGAKAKYDKLIAGGLLLQARWGVPEDVGRAVAMLAQGDLPYSTGQVLMVDGGFSVQRL